MNIFNVKTKSIAEYESIVGKDISVQVVDESFWDGVWSVWKPTFTHVDVGECTKKTDRIIGIRIGKEVKYFEIGSACGNARIIEVL